jgi:BolA family transcriptional regulator, general stress-responsive regulator
MDNETYQARITRKLRAAFSPILLEVHDDSALHAGHAGQNPLGESHFRVLIVSQSFEPLSRVVRHRKIYEALAEELKDRVHALSLQSFTPLEYTNR